MFCSKCGNKITENDVFCPKCGEKNDNYVELVKNSFTLLKIIIPLAIVLIVAVVALLFINLLPKNTSLFSMSGIDYTSQGITAYCNSDKSTGYFIYNDKVKEINAEIKTARSTPDLSKFIVLTNSGKLEMYFEDIYESKTIDIDVNSIIGIGNDGVFFSKTEKEHIFYYVFKSYSIKDLGLEECQNILSSRKTALASIDKNNTLYVFKTKDETPSILCSVNNDSRLNAVADDGSNVIWSNEDDNSFSVFVIKNGAPERIAQLNKAKEYCSVYAKFFNDSKSYYVSGSNCTQLIISRSNNVVNTVTLPGVMGYSGFFNQNGQSIDSDDDCLDDIFFCVFNNKDSSVQKLCRVTKDNRLEVLVQGISDYPYLRNNKIYYVDEHDDFYVTEIDNTNEKKCITTAIDYIQMSINGEIAYIVKSNTLYYWKTDNTNNQLNMIVNSFKSDCDIYVTNDASRIFYISDKTEIPDRFIRKGVLYSYRIGETVIPEASDIMYVLSDNDHDINPDFPILMQYVNTVDKYDYIVNIGTLSDKRFQILASNIQF